MLLLQEILIGVTHFFREPEAFAYLKEKVIPKILAQKPKGYVIRAWVAGCSTGEEAYSLSILGNLKGRQGQYDQALDALSRAAELNPQSAEIQNSLGLALSHKGLRGPAESALRRAITLDPNYGSAHPNIQSDGCDLGIQ